MHPEWELTLRLAFAAVLGSAVGVERERLLWAAGLRTHMLVAVGACLAMIVSAYGFGDVLGPHVVLDPSRIAAQVVSGVGFLGAGSIILRNEVVKGLTTAASLWAVAAIGLAVGGGLYLCATTATAIILVILAGIKPLEERLRGGRRAVELHLMAERGAMSVGLLQQVLKWRASAVKQIFVQPGEDAARDEVTLILSAMPSRDIDAIIDTLSQAPSIFEVRRMRP